MHVGRMEDTHVEIFNIYTPLNATPFFYLKPVSNLNTYFLKVSGYLAAAFTNSTTSLASILFTTSLARGGLLYDCTRVSVSKPRLYSTSSSNFRSSIKSQSKKSVGWWLVSGTSSFLLSKSSFASSTAL